MPQSICAYCKTIQPLTREHLWPTSLHSRLVEGNPIYKTAFWMARLNKTIASEPQIRDVCAKCNNEILSELDAYICNLFDTTFVHAPLRYEKIQFEYDYHFLKRWLLKMCFNSARIHNSPDFFALEALLPYILGKRTDLSQSTQMFIQLTFPQEVPPEDLESEVGLDQPMIFYPDLNRVGFIHFTAPGIGKKLLRAVHLRSFTFFIAFWQPGKGQSEQYDFEKQFTSHLTGTTLLRPNRPKLIVECNGMGAWDSFKNSRNNHFVFDEGS